MQTPTNALLGQRYPGAITCVVRIPALSWLRCTGTVWAAGPRKPNGPSENRQSIRPRTAERESSRGARDQSNAAAMRTGVVVRLPTWSGGRLLTTLVARTTA